MNRLLASRTGALIFCVAASTAAGPAPPAMAQIAPAGIKSAPHDGYFAGFGPFLDGDFREAGREFREAGRSGIVNADHLVGGPWIDAICYHAMMGECAYQLGDLAGALEQFTAALNRFVLNRTWMLRIEFPPGISPEQNIKTTSTWGTSARRTVVGDFQERYPSLRGRLDNSNVLKTGGVIAAPSMHPVYVSEIVRCTTLAISRRRTLLGPTCEFDPLTAQVLDALSQRPGPPNHWSQCWIDLQLGVANAAAGRLPQAMNELNKSLLAADRFDHPLTCVGLLELGRLNFEEGKYEVALNQFHEATISAAYFEQYVVMEEAFRLGAEAHLLAGRGGVYPPLAPAAAATPRVRMLQVSLLISLGEQFLTGGDTQSAAQSLGQARSAMGRREMAQGSIGARLNYLTARASLAAGDAKAGAAALVAALNYQKGAGRQLFHIGLADSMFRGGGASERILDALFQDVLREPTPRDWRVDPLDTLATLAAPHPLPYEHWLELAIARRDFEKALLIGDRIRRHRFFASQPLGGRLLALRWILEAPTDALRQTALAERQEWLARYPLFGELSRRAKEIRAQAQQLPAAPLEESQAKRGKELLAELGQLSAAQESLLQAMSLDRMPSEFVFPPLLETKDIQQHLPEGTQVFTFLATSRSVYGFGLSRDRYGHFKLAQPAKVKADVSEFLRGMGHTDRSQPVAAADLAANGWQAAGQRLVKQLFDNAKPADWAEAREIVLVPDGVLWYLPFEALPIADESGEAVPLLLRVPLRYAPTLALAVPSGRQPRPLPRTAIVAGKLLPREDEAFSKTALDTIVAASGEAAVLRKELPAPAALLAATYDRAIVLADGDDEKSPLAWSPFQIDNGKPGGTLADWIQLPYGGAEQLVLPGFHTPAEVGLKKGGTGEDVFMAICGLMSSGSRTVLLSRWRVGGQSTVELMREFLQELPHESAASAWRRSVQLAADRPLDPTTELRLRATGGIDSLKADHPFFWSGYLLADRGQAPAAPDAETAPITGRDDAAKAAGIRPK